MPTWRLNADVFVILVLGAGVSCMIGGVFVPYVIRQIGNRYH
jgi:hypothetical protein